MRDLPVSQAATRKRNGRGGGWVEGCQTVTVAGGGSGSGAGASSRGLATMATRVGVGTATAAAPTHAALALSFSTPLRINRSMVRTPACRPS